jgi:pyruvate,orthophosphate dikinase
LRGRPPSDDAESGGPTAEVLFALSLCGAGAPAELARGTGLAEAVVRSALADLEGAGRVAIVDPRNGGGSLTAAGREAAQQVVRREREVLAGEVSPRYARFTVLDRALKQAVSRWQVRTVGDVEVANDHRDRAHDAAVLDEIRDVCGRAVAWLDPLTRRRSRYRRYRERLESALARIEAGEVGWIAGIEVDSLHSIWWQLHSDLLAILGRRRGAAEA